MGKRARWWLLCVAALLGGALIIWAVVHRREPHPGQFDDGEPSSDLPGDLRLMWETRPLDKGRASTDRAINAASRAFNTVELSGKARDEVVAVLGDPRTASDSMYNFPFWPAPKAALVYRFDRGNYVWQFNVLIGDDGRVRAVERHWIH